MDKIQTEFLDYMQNLSKVAPPSAAELQMFRMVWFTASSSMLATLATAIAEGRELEATREAQAELRAVMKEWQDVADKRG